MGVTIQCKQLALAKVLCHAAKHLTCTVNGVLLGTVSGDTVTVADAIPLFHASHALSAPAEIALALVNAHVDLSGAGLSIVGYYHSDARFAAGDLTPVGRKLADKIAGKQPAAVVLLLDNKKLGAWMGPSEETQQPASTQGVPQHPFEAFTREGGARGWHREPDCVALADGSWAGLLSETNRLLKQRLHTTLVDMDDHLDDVSKDWTNPQLATLGKFALPGQQA